MKDFIVLTEAVFDEHLSRPARLILAVDSIVSIQEITFTEFINMDKEMIMHGSLVVTNAGATVGFRVRDSTQSILEKLNEIAKTSQA